MANAAPLILLLGMHRSGTSLLGGLLKALGVGMPGQLIAADQHNPDGYFEWREVVDLQERLLIDLDRWWPSEQGALPLPQGWQRHPATQAMRQPLRALLQQEIPQQSGPWAIKDPRTSRLLPLWLDLAAELDIPLRLLLAVRDPAEVARSLIQRDGPITGMDLARAQQLWWRHNLEPLHAAPAALPLAVVDFGAWFHEPEQQLDRLLALIPEVQPTEEQRSAALSLIRPEYRRSLERAAELPVERRVRRLHRQLLAPFPSALPRPSAEPPRVLNRGRAKFGLDPGEWHAWLDRWRHYPAPRHPGYSGLTDNVVLSTCGATHHHWATHLWIQRLPVPELGVASFTPECSDAHNLSLQMPGATAGLTRLAINLELPSADRAEHWLAHLRHQQLIWDPEPARVLLLRALGLPSYWLDPMAPSNGWLTRPVDMRRQWGALLGLPQPSPCTCLVLGLGGEAWEHALAQWECQGQDETILYLPQLLSADTAGSVEAYLQAAWLWASALIAEEVVVFGSDAEAGNPALACLRDKQLKRILSPITPSELIAELHGVPTVFAEDRAAPEVELLCVRRREKVAQAAVAVSLYNYSSQIQAALESISEQTLSSLELVVVDDASTDHGCEVVRGWLEQHADRFSGVQLLRHRVNTGLAVARNTAFAACTAEWVFVLDADNLLFPAAVEACLQQATQAAPDVAVIHPWVEVLGDGRYGHDGRSLISRVSWQRDAFLKGNVIDAMALVRRSAWQAVGGYTHIEGGWEDFDFWCKLIDAGYHGLLCPRVLARYHTHADSMTASFTTRNWRSLSRCLQARHPWLDLPYAR